MKLLLILFAVSTLLLAAPVAAIYDPLSVPNNRAGVHILDPQEIHSAAKLVNSNGGDWGYVTIPIRSNDRDAQKWKEFFSQAKKLKLIPIVRLATYPDGANWQAPTIYDLVDFAEFLSEMPWPVKNRYIIMFNEPNHSKEWGGRVAPDEYAQLISHAKSIFSSRSGDFFLLGPGLDMSAPQNKTSFDALEFYRRMTIAVPGWLNYLDGLVFHAYPNPGFLAPPSSRTRYGITSFEYELDYLVNRLKLGRADSLPLFITETGTLSQSAFYPQAWQVWSDPRIVAITPFLLFASTPDFSGFSLLDANHQPKNHYRDLQDLPKQTGSPLLSNTYLYPLPPAEPSPAGSSGTPHFNLFDRVKSLWPFRSPTLTVGSKVIKVELAETQAKQTQGLSGRKGLPENTGMLFVFPQSRSQIFWMKDMKFSLDFVWINSGKVVHIHENILPPDQTGGSPAVVSPPVPADLVLEVPAGFVRDRGIKIGDPVTLNH